MAGTKRDSAPDDDAGVLDESGEEADRIDDGEEGDGILASVKASFGGGEADVEDVQEDGDGGGGLLGRVRDAVQDDEHTGPSRAELVDGANVLFIDPAAKSKALYEYDLVLITAPQYPEPVVLKNDTPIEVPKGSVLCSAKSATMIDYAGKRVLARSFILVPPERADEVAPEYLEDVPEALVGKTVPRREVQNAEFYQLVVNAASASES